jgi:hypothetical protein
MECKADHGAGEIMSQLLTDEEIAGIGAELAAKNIVSDICFARELEKLFLAKLGAQEPVAEVQGSLSGGSFVRRYVDLPIGTTLFAAPPIPAGMVMVPIEPTEAMMDSADQAYDEFEKSESGVWYGAKDIYRAMLAAAGVKP